MLVGSTARCPFYFSSQDWRLGVLSNHGWDVGAMSGTVGEDTLCGTEQESDRHVAPQREVDLLDHLFDLSSVVVCDGRVAARPYDLREAEKRRRRKARGLFETRWSFK